MVRPNPDHTRLGRHRRRRSATHRLRGVGASHRVRERLVSQRTGIINQIRAFLLERGVAVRQGLRFLRAELPRILAAPSDALSPRMLRVIEELAGDWRRLDERIEGLSSEIEALARQTVALMRVFVLFQPDTGVRHDSRKVWNGRMDRRPSLASFCADEKRGSHCAGLAAAIPLPQGIAPPVTEVPPSGLTKFLISRENELGLSGSPRGGPSEGRAGNQRDQRESGDKRFHDASRRRALLGICERRPFSLGWNCYKTVAPASIALRGFNKQRRKRVAVSAAPCRPSSEGQH
jgi:hypothetical protein